MNRKEEEKEVDPCKKFACELQYCLQRSGYIEANCTAVIIKLQKCCQTNYSHQGRSSKVSDTCSGFVILK